MNFVTTVRVFNGLPGYCDVDYEYFFTEHYPTQSELREFDRQACSNFCHVRNSQVQVDAVKSQERDESAHEQGEQANGAVNGSQNADNELSKAALQSEQQP